MHANVKSKHQLVAWPTDLPPLSRPQPRQQARAKDPQYLTLESLSKIFHLFRTPRKRQELSETTTEVSTSTSTSAKHRGMEQLQRTAIRWWKPNRSLDSSFSSSTNTEQYEEISTILPNYPEHHFPLLTIVSNSTRQLNPYDDPSDIPSERLPPVTRPKPPLMQVRGMRLHPRFYPPSTQANVFHRGLVDQS